MDIVVRRLNEADVEPYRACRIEAVQDNPSAFLFDTVKAKVDCCGRARCLLGWRNEAGLWKVGWSGSCDCSERCSAQTEVRS